MDQADFPWRPLGLLLVDNGLVTPTELEIALDEQRRTGRLLGQILGNGSVTDLVLAQALTEQHGIELRPCNGAEEPLLTESQRQVDERSGQLPEPQAQDRAWRPPREAARGDGVLKRNGARAGARRAAGAAWPPTR